MQEIQVVLVFETSRLKRTDDAYYQWMLKTHFHKEMSRQGNCGLRILFNYVYMDGKTNYKKRSLLSDIKGYQRGYSGKTYVVYCFDIDTKTNDDKKFLAEVKSFCKANNYRVSFAYPEIEVCFGYGADKGDKVCRARLFAQNYPKKESVKKANIFVPLDLEPSSFGSGQTNFCSIIQSIIDENR